MASTWDISDAMLQAFLNALKTNAYYTAGDFEIHLFSNQYSPVPGTTLQNFTECNFAGYAAIQFDPTQFGQAAIANHVASATYPTQVTFAGAANMVGNQNVWGYYVTDSNNNYAWAEGFSAAFVMTAGAQFIITPRVLSETGQ